MDRPEGPGQQWVQSGAGSRGWRSCWARGSNKERGPGGGGRAGLLSAAFSGVSLGPPHLGGRRPLPPRSDWSRRVESARWGLTPGPEPSTQNLPELQPPTLTSPLCLHSSARWAQGDTRAQTTTAAACTRAAHSGASRTASAMRATSWRRTARPAKVSPAPLSAPPHARPQPRPSLGPAPCSASAPPLSRPPHARLGPAPCSASAPPHARPRPRPFWTPPLARAVARPRSRVR